MEESVTSKTCTKCNQTKELKHFDFRLDTNKFRNHCKKCHKNYKTTLFEKREQIYKLLENNLKECSRCKTIKHTNEFSVDKITLTGFCSYCKTCTNLKNKVKSKEIKSNRLKRIYNISIEEYDEMLLLQNGVCYICKSPPKNNTSKQCSLAVDHCHKTGSVRKLLCFSCNVALGFVDDDISRLEKLIEYLKEHNTTDTPSN